MKVSYNWINQYVDITDIDPKELSEKMSRTGIEVDGLEQPGLEMKNIVVGRVVSTAKHPDADKLTVCQVEVGQEEPIQIVCGAPNVATGQLVIVALHKSVIAGGYKIKKGKLRGEVSNGMICSLSELGFSDSVVPKAYADGIYNFPETGEVKPGDDAIEALGLNDAILETDITPNRADALSMIGTAYEIGAIYDRPVNIKDAELKANSDQTTADYIQVKVEDGELAPMYHALIIDDVEVKESPLWLQTRLMHAGIRPINNIVDITNYILVYYGQPLHAFDYDLIGSKEILVRLANKSEKLTTLDGTERVLSDDDIVITNGQKPLAIAGVMGGLETEITSDTKRVIIEAAMFEPAHIRRTSSRFGLRSESSVRNERGVNTSTVLEAGEYAANLMAELAGGKIYQGHVADNAVVPENKVVNTTFSYINRIIGMDLSQEEILKSLAQLGFETRTSDDKLTVSVPPRRWDISIPADIVEEVIRIYGYDKVPLTLPVSETKPAQLTHTKKLKRFTEAYLEGCGLDQAITYSLTTADQAQAMVLEEGPSIALSLPMSEDRSTLRQSIVPSLIEVAKYNQSRHSRAVEFYEMAHTFIKDGDQPKETLNLAGILSGNKTDNQWTNDAVTYDFYDLKGILEEYFAKIGLLDSIVFEILSDFENMHPGRTAKVVSQGKFLGYLGQLHPRVAEKYDLGETFVFELNLDAISDLTEDQELVSQSLIPRYPGVSRDIALLVDEKVSHQEILDIIQANGGDYLIDVSLFDIYQGDKIEEGKKSMAYHLSYLNLEATLVEEDVTRDFNQVKDALVEELKVTIR